MRKIKAMIYAWISAKYMHGCSNYNTLQVRKSCRAKSQGRAVFAEKGVPHAQGMVFFWPWTAAKFVAEHGFPVVIKPNVSGYSRGSYFPIQSKRELYRAILWAKVWWPTTIIERYLQGANYRVLATREELVSVIRRYPPFVVGNGVASIGELIDAENQLRQKMNLYPVIHPIATDKNARRHLAKQGLTLDSVPAQGQQVEIFHRVALAPGGAIEIIEQSTIPQQNRQLFNRIVKMFDANILGIDVIFAHGIEQPWDEQACIVIEVNSRPYIEMHHYPRYGQAQDFNAALARLDRLELNDTDIF